MRALRRLLIVGGLVLALGAGGALAVRGWLLRDTTEPVSVQAVVEAARAASGAEVYAYDTTGFEEARVLGTTRHDYPATTTITVTRTGCGTALHWEALDRRSERWTICDGVPARLDDEHAFFGRTDERRYRCRGRALAFTCARDGTTRTDRGRDLGIERVEVAGETLPARHLRFRTRMDGDTRGSGTVDLWLARGDGPPLRVVVANASETDTPIGTSARYRERFELRLRSRRPL